MTSSSVFSMFGGGAKKEKKDEDEDRGDNSGSAKAQREAAAAAAAAKKEGEEVSFDRREVGLWMAGRLIRRRCDRRINPLSPKMSTSSPSST